MLQRKGNLSANQLLLLLLLHLFNGLFFRATWVSRYQKGKTSPDLSEARDDGVLGCSGISRTICKQSAPRSRQITTQTPYHSIFTDRMLFLMPNQQCQSTEGSLAAMPTVTQSVITDTDRVQGPSVLAEEVTPAAVRQRPTVALMRDKEDDDDGQDEAKMQLLDPAQATHISTTQHCQLLGNLSHKLILKKLTKRF